MDTEIIINDETITKEYTKKNYTPLIVLLIIWVLLELLCLISGTFMFYLFILRLIFFIILFIIVFALCYTNHMSWAYVVAFLPLIIPILVFMCIFYVFVLATYLGESVLKKAVL